VVQSRRRLTRPCGLPRQNIANRAAIELQRMGRGLTVRLKYRRERREIKLKIAAIKIQALLRGVSARMKRAALKRQWVIAKAATTIQRHIRALLVRTPMTSNRMPRMPHRLKTYYQDAQPVVIRGVPPPAHGVRREERSMKGAY
jgi:hypothetical protein